MKIASWNVNSVRAREQRLLRWLARHQPDVLCLQELKVPDEGFPEQALREAGYQVAAHGQRTYNGVAILARTEILNIQRGWIDPPPDPQARLVAAQVGPIWVLSAYVPNGGEVGSEKWTYKLEWLARLRRYLDREFDPTQALAVCGDFNVAPEARDVHDPSAWETTPLFHPQARAALQHVLDWGLSDTFRLHHAEEGHYSWWDYRRLAFPKNMGLRIDHILVSQPLRVRCVAAQIDRQERKGDHPSDHVPVLAEFDETAFTSPRPAV